MKKVLKKRSIDFSLENNYYKKLNFMLHSLLAITIIIIYILATLIYSKHNIILTLCIFAIVTIYFHRNKSKLTNILNEFIQNQKKKQFQDSPKTKIKKTFKKISHRNKKLKLEIKSKLTIKEKAAQLKTKLKRPINITEKTNKETKEEKYINIED